MYIKPREKEFYIFYRAQVFEIIEREGVLYLICRVKYKISKLENKVFNILSFTFCTFCLSLTRAIQNDVLKFIEALWLVKFH